MDLRWPLRIHEERRDGALILVLAGRLGTASVVQFDAAVTEAVLRSDRRLVIDLKDERESYRRARRGGEE